MDPDENNSALNSLKNMFYGIVSEEVITTILECCGGDLNQTADTIMKITNDVNDNRDMENCASTSKEFEENKLLIKDKNKDSALPEPNFNPSISETLSYASAFYPKTGAVPKRRIKPITTNPKEGWNDEIRRIINHHANGSRILIIMRGVPGSGKTHLAQKIVEMTIGSTFADFKTHILSTDDYFMVNGQYKFDKFKLQKAHSWNYDRASILMHQGLSPVIIDNTNIEMWELEPYVRKGVECGYILEVVEPNTPWAKKASHLAKINVHNVPLVTITRMLNNYMNAISANSIMNYFCLRYPPNRVPPVLRLMPAVKPISYESPHANRAPPIEIKLPSIVDDNNKQQTDNPPTPKKHTNEKAASDFQKAILTDNSKTTLLEKTEQINKVVKIDEASVINIQITGTNPQNLQNQGNNNENCQVVESENKIQVSELQENTIEPESLSIQQSPIIGDAEDNTCKNLYLDVQKQLEDMEKIEHEWENGENWDNNTPVLLQIIPEKESTLLAPKPPRNSNVIQSNIHPTHPEQSSKSDKNCDDSSQRSLSMPQVSSSETLPVEIQKISIGTSMEIGDTNLKNNRFKIVSASARDINEFHISFNITKIPESGMLDKASMTNKMDILVKRAKCKTLEKHFKEFKKLFKNISPIELREIFDYCCGDVNWAVDIVLDEYLVPNDQEEMSDDDEDSIVCDEHCTCLAARQILPDAGLETENIFEPKNLSTSKETDSTTHIPKKAKRDNNVSEELLNLKRLIEKNIGFSSNHYSDHCLKIKNLRHGEIVEDKPPGGSLNDNTTDNETAELQDTEEGLQDTASCLPDNEKAENDAENNDDDDLGWISNDEAVVVNIGKAFVMELDALFGRKDMTYPDNVAPKINMPLTLLNEINALWMESLMHQLDELDKQSVIMLKEDEQLARELAQKEIELAQNGKDPEVPDFKEIMDLDLALSLHQKDIAEWRNKEPNDLAAKLTREKLYNLFPDVSKEVLSELLMAHDNNFQSTVESLLVSTGKADLLSKKNGVTKFVMEREMQMKKQMMETQKDDFTIENWPKLRHDKPIDLSEVQKYRNLAKQHLTRRQYNHEKANQYMRRGMLEMANFYQQAAEFHKKRYEQANGYAAALLMQIHSARCNNFVTIDLHYLFVNEALEALDVFLDLHIQRLKESGRPVGLNLYFITGRGLHSDNGRPRIRPAVIRRLLARGLRVNELNPGLVASRVGPLSLQSHEVD